MSDPQALAAQLRAGQLDAIIGGTNRDLESLSKSKKFQVQPLKGAEQQVYVGANLKNPDLQDVSSARRIAYAVDRHRVIEDVYRGAGYPVNLPWPKYSPAYDAKANTTYARDLAKAKALVQQVSKGAPHRHPAAVRHRQPATSRRSRRSCSPTSRRSGSRSTSSRSSTTSSSRR